MREPDSVKATMRRILQAKEQRRRELARLPFEEKIAIVLRLQEVANMAARAPAACRRAH